MVNGYLTEVASVMEGELSCYREGHFNGRRMVMLQKCPVNIRLLRNVYWVVTLMEREWSCYRGGQFNGGRIVMLQRQPV